MFPNDEWAKKKVVLMGLGGFAQGSGISAAKFFIGKCRELVITDLKTEKELKKQISEINQFVKTPEHLNTTSLHHYITTSQKQKNNLTIRPFNHITKVIWHLGGHRVADFKTADLIFQNPSVPADSPYLKIARQAGVPIVNDWSIFLSVHDPKVFVGVTGTRGKSTTTALIYEMMKKKYKKVWLAGNIGLSPLNFIDSYGNEPMVAELSSWLLHHFPKAQKSPNIAVVTNIMKDHLDKYQNMKEYIADKENIFKFQKAGGIVVLNQDNQYTREMSAPFLCHSERSPAQRDEVEESLKSQILKSKIVWFSLKKHLPRWVPLKKIKLLGEHNLANALAAVAAAEAAGVSRRDILLVLRNFRGLPNRLELVRTTRGIKYYNDTTATTPDATIVALKTLGQIKSKIIPPAGGLKSKIILIAGGADKKLEYRELAKYIKRYCKAVVLLPGTATLKIKKTIKQLNNLTIEVKSMAEAIKMAKKIAERGDNVLLSPAAASFGLFKNEFERGEEFKKIVTQFQN